ncbi:MAG: DUF1571 domain-containing protein [Planctomycetaceae bacterium]
MSHPPHRDQTSTSTSELDDRQRHVCGSRWSWRSFAVGALFSALLSTILGGNLLSRSESSPGATNVGLAGAEVRDAETSGGSTTESSMEEVLELAQRSLANMQRTLEDYTARLVKQETIDGVLSEPNEMAIKVQCSRPDGKLDDTAPQRVYLRFNQPSDVAGRKVIWARDLHDGKLVVHEAGLMGLLTVRLDPTGMIAMRGQRYPIYELGLAKLVEKLIERGEPDRNNPDVTVSITNGLEFDGRDCQRIEVRRKQPSNAAEDFSKAEIYFDSERLLPLRYAAYGWSETEAPPPLIESYTYLDIKTNVGLSESDFDPNNPSYQFP